jgi:sulfite reductase alpha subunit-like flavoprotein
MRGFLQELRQSTLNIPGFPHQVELFFGCQNHHKFLYETELKGYEADKTLTSLNVCFSREGERKYVQKEIVTRKVQIWKMLCNGAHIYVCGDASRMAPAVKAAFKTVASEAGGLSEAKASAFVDHLCAMGDSKRYHEDVWAGNA